MSSLLMDYEQEFGTVTADITSKLCKFNKGNVHGSQIRDLEKIMEEAKELLENIEMEIRECTDLTQREKLNNRVKSYKVEFSRLKVEVDKAIKKTERSELLSSDGLGNGSYINDDLKQQLINDDDKLEITSSRINRSYQIALETEAIGAEVLGDLHGQRNTLQHARDRLREVDGDLDRSSRLVSTMLRHAQQHKFIVTAIGLVVFLFIIICIYIAFSRGS